MTMEDPLFKTRLHYIVLTPPICLMIVGILLAVLLPILKYVALAMTVGGLLWFLVLYSAISFSFFAVYNKAVSVQSGIIARQSVTLPISKIETVEVTQTLFGAILNYGTVMLVGTGGTQNVFKNLAKPLETRRHIERLINHV